MRPLALINDLNNALLAGMLPLCHPNALLDENFNKSGRPLEVEARRRRFNRLFRCSYSTSESRRLPDSCYTRAHNRFHDSTLKLNTRSSWFRSTPSLGTLVLILGLALVPRYLAS